MARDFSAEYLNFGTQSSGATPLLQIEGEIDFTKMENEYGKCELSPEELRKLQLKSLEMAVYFRDFCKQNGLKFFLCGGCCIGAVRNKGFVPWDDDVDVFMPRDDYEKLGKMWGQRADTSRYSYCRADEAHHYRNLFATINDNNTTFIKTHQADLDINHGVALDILPLDGCPNSRAARGIQVFWALVYSIFCAQMVPVNHGRMVNFCGKVLLGLVPSRKLRYKIWRFAERQMSKHKVSDCNNVTELCSGPRYMRNKYPKSAFSEALEVDFECEKMPIPKGYDEYLRMAFGDYMRLPPEEKRVPHHDAVFCDLSNGYASYKGEYYCKGERK